MAKPKRVRETTNTFGRRVNQAMEEQRIPGDYAALAAIFEVKVPSVYGWIDNGRISKSKLPKLVEWSGRPLEWWLNSEQPSTDHAAPFASNALAKLEMIGQNLSESDWQALIHVAQQLASKASPAQLANPQQLPPQILPEYTDAIEEQVREAHERYEKEHKRRRAAPG